jgi:hypothetical protein
VECIFGVRIGDDNILEALPHYYDTCIENSEWEEMGDQFIVLSKRKQILLVLKTTETNYKMLIL